VFYDMLMGRFTEKTLMSIHTSIWTLCALMGPFPSMTLAVCMPLEPFDDIDGSVGGVAGHFVESELCRHRPYHKRCGSVLKRDLVLFTSPSCC